MNNWLVYIVQCRDNSLYCGTTNNLEKRMNAHNSGLGSKYTRSRLPVKLIINSKPMSKKDAYSLEYKIKRLPANKKIQFLEQYL